MNFGMIKLTSVIVYFTFILGLSSSTLADNSPKFSKNIVEKKEINYPTPPIILDTGGPDDFGYYFIDSADSASNAPVYNWVDITSVGTNMDIVNDDQSVGPFPVGFSFNYYGYNFTEFRACSNGFLAFTSYNTAYSNAPMPLSDLPNDLIAVFWDDLNPGDNGVALYYNNNVDSCVISWLDFQRYNGPGIYSFQVILTGDSNIVFQYLSVTQTLDSHTIGIEDRDGLVGLQYIYDEPNDETGTAIYFGLTPPIYPSHDVAPISFVNLEHNGLLNSPVNLMVSVRNLGLFTETFDTHLTINNTGLVFADTVNVAGLQSGNTTEARFSNYSPSETGSYLITAITDLNIDEVPGNDTLNFQYNVFSSIYFTDLEEDSAGFSVSGDWQWGIPEVGPTEAYSGEKLWATKLSSYYSNSSSISSLITPGYYIEQDAVLGFWHWYDIENEFDGCNVKISLDAGVNWDLLFPDGGYDAIASLNNPLLGEPIFSGRNNSYWQFETFDLSEFAGSALLFKLDFGADDNVNFAGWYIDDFTIYGGGEANTGTISGIVTDFTTGNPIEGAEVTVAAISDITGADGLYQIDIVPGTYSVRADAEFYNYLTRNDIIVVEGNTVEVDFPLFSPGIQIDTTPIYATIDEGDTVTYVRQLSNPGNGFLNYRIRITLGEGLLASSINEHSKGRLISDLDFRYTDVSQSYIPTVPPMTLDFGDEIFSFDPQTPTADNTCLGVEFDGFNFWVTGRDYNNGNVHKLYKFDSAGNLLESFDQGTTTIWGWRDLAWDGEYLYAADENELAKIDSQTGLKIAELPMPSSINHPLRALAYDPATDHFWAANFNSDIIEFNRNGETLNSYSNQFSIYGLAWDNITDGGPWLWAFSQDGAPATMVSQFNPSTGEFTGVSFNAIDHNGGDDDLAGGLCFTTEWDYTRAALFCLVQGMPVAGGVDMIQGYEIAPFSGWLSVNPLLGQLLPSENIDLNIMIDLSEISINSDTTINGTVIVENNSSTIPQIPVSIDVITGISNDDIELPIEFNLGQNYPNPFNPNTEIELSIPEQSEVSLEIYNLLGQRVEVLVDKLLSAGLYQYTWNASDFASGVYYYKLTAGENSSIKKMLLLK